MTARRERDGNVGPCRYDQSTKRSYSSAQSLCWAPASGSCAPQRANLSRHSPHSTISSRRPNRRVRSKKPVAKRENRTEASQSGDGVAVTQRLYHRAGQARAPSYRRQGAGMSMESSISTSRRRRRSILCPGSYPASRNASSPIGWYSDPSSTARDSVASGSHPRSCVTSIRW